MPVLYSWDERIQAFWAKVDFDGPTKDDTLGPCWLWTGCIGRWGYGKLGWRRDGRGITAEAHSTAYRVFVGPVPQGMVLDHLCRTPRCVKWQHLEPVTPRENWRRGMSPSAVVFAGAACGKGHPLDASNVYRLPASQANRRCRACNRIAVAKYLAKKRGGQP